MKFLISNFKFQINTNHRKLDIGHLTLEIPRVSGVGFTLIEVLIVMAVAATVGTVVFSIIFTTIRSYNKANSVTLVRQNGDNAISQMARLIRSGKTFDGVGTGDDTFITTCPQTTSAPPYSQVKLTSFDGTSIVLSCEAETITLNGASLINTAEVALGENPCYFACTQAAPADAPRIDINFSLVRRDANGVIDKQTKLDFHTSVIPRNTTQ
ncbi:MAG: prepilin-type N-terminal cleavage/methylation domain-containing protein [Candidatus Levybacteria bacterium]|nr:prepilin-type N-terminal cleavage/methylation domain-containing protein [Candidatus Levybacteria bacterium]